MRGYKSTGRVKKVPCSRGASCRTRRGARALRNDRPRRAGMGDRGRDCRGREGGRARDQLVRAGEPPRAARPRPPADVHRATFIHRISDGQILETWRNADDLGRVFQLGGASSQERPTNSGVVGQSGSKSWMASNTGLCSRPEQVRRSRRHNGAHRHDHGVGRVRTVLRLGKADRRAGVRQTECGGRRMGAAV